MSEKLCFPATERNKEPILGVLRQVLPDSGTVLEIASGSGQHAEHFARNLPEIQWQPSEADKERLPSIRAWAEEAELANLLAPVHLDVVSEAWPVNGIAAIFNANMIHITPWQCCLGLLAGARRHLQPGGLLVIYGPFKVSDEPWVPSNEAFDQSLRERNPDWGVRELDEIVQAADGLQLEDRLPMPANNQILVFRRKHGSEGLGAVK